MRVWVRKYKRMHKRNSNIETQTCAMYINYKWELLYIVHVHDFTIKIINFGPFSLSLSLPLSHASLITGFLPIIVYHRKEQVDLIWQVTQWQKKELIIINNNSWSGCVSWAWLGVSTCVGTSRDCLTMMRLVVQSTCVWVRPCLPLPATACPCVPLLVFGMCVCMRLSVFSTVHVCDSLTVCVCVLGKWKW